MDNKAYRGEFMKWWKKRIRFILKTLTYKVLSILITIVAAWALTGDPYIGLTLGLIEATIKVAVYYVHEEIWYSGRKYFKNRKKSS